jgi:hypothetical protein
VRIKKRDPPCGEDRIFADPSQIERLYGEQAEAHIFNSAYVCTTTLRISEPEATAKWLSELVGDIQKRRGPEPSTPGRAPRRPQNETIGHGRKPHS